MTEESLAEVDAEGRLDVVLYRLAENACRLMENKYEVKGLWDELSETIEDQIKEYIPEDTVLDIPPSFKVLLKAMKGNGND